MSAVAGAGAGGDRGDGGKKDSPSKDSGKGSSKPTSKLYGKPGKKRCLICHALHDHVAANCPGNQCRRCGAADHWARECPIAKCDWCGDLGHDMSKCPKGASKYLSSKRPAIRPLDQAPGAKTMRTGTFNVDSGTSKKPFISKVGSFLEEVEADTLMDPEEVQQRRDELGRRREVVETKYREAMADLDRRRVEAMNKIDVDEEQLELELENESEFKKAIDQLADLKKKVLSGKKRSLASVVNVSSTKHVEVTGTGGCSYAAVTSGKPATVVETVIAPAVIHVPADDVSHNDSQSSALDSNVEPQDLSRASPAKEDSGVNHNDSQSSAPDSNVEPQDLSRAPPVKEDSGSEGNVEMLPREPPSEDSGGESLWSRSKGTGGQEGISGTAMDEDELLGETKEGKSESSWGDTEDK